MLTQRKWSTSRKINNKALTKIVMPKMKTNSSAKKRFKLTGTGKIKRKHAFKSHILTKKSTKAKRALTATGLVHETDEYRVKRMLGMA